jgi:hypothetical protein
MPGKNIFRSLIVLAALAAALGLFGGCGQDEGQEAWESFQILMNRAFGEGRWSAQGHKATGGVLTITGFSASLSGLAEQIPVAGLDAAALKNPLTAESLQITGLPPKAELSGIAAGGPWAGAADIALAAKVVVRNAKTAQTLEGLDITASYDALEAAQITLAGSDPPPSPEPRGGLSFLKALRLGSLSYKNVRVAFSEEAGSEEAKAGAGAGAESAGAGAEAGAKAGGLSGSLLLGSYSAQNISFAGPQIFRDNSFLDIIYSFKAEKLSWTGVELEASEAGGGTAETWSLKIEGADLAELDGPFRAGSLSLKNISAQAGTAASPQAAFALRAGEFTLAKLDAFEFARSLTKGLAGEDFFADPGRASQKLENNLDDSLTLADLLSHPYDLDSWSLSGLSLTASGITFGVDKLAWEGPAKRRAITSSKTSLSGLSINLRNTGSLPKGWQRDIKELTDFAGADSLTISGSLELAYDPESGSAKYTYSGWTFDPLGAVDASVELSGLTQALVDRLAAVSLRSAAAHLLRQGLGGAGVKSFSITYQEKSLVGNILKKLAADAGAAEPDHTERLRAEMVKYLEGQAADFGNPPFFSNLIMDAENFLANPQTLTISMSPDEPLTQKSAPQASLSGPTEEEAKNFLNFLKLSFSANGGEATTVRFD